MVARHLAKEEEVDFQEIVPEDSKKAHRKKASKGQLVLFELLGIVIPPLLIASFAFLPFNLIILPLLAIGIIYSINFPKTVGVDSVVTLQIVGIVTTIFSLILPFFFSDEQISTGFLDGYAVLIVLIICGCFGIEMLRKERTRLVVSVISSVSLCLLISCLSGYVMTNRLFLGVYRNYIVLNAFCLIILGLTCLVAENIFKGEHKLLKHVIGYFAIIFSSVFFNFVIAKSFTNFELQGFDFIYAIVTISLAFSITITHFKTKSTFPALIVRLFTPIILLGASIYIVSVLV